MKMKKWSSQWTQFTQLRKVGFFTQLRKLRSLRRSFLHFHFISAVHIWFISYIINTHFFHGNIWTHNWPSPNVNGFIAQLVEHRTIARSRVQTPLKSWIFSGSFTLLHKLHSLRRSFLHFQCIFWSFWCDRVNLNSCTHQERTEEDEGNEVNVSERAATCARWIHHPGITHCTALTR